MPKLEAYSRDLEYSYAPGLFPAMECVNHAPNRCLRLLLSTKLRMSDETEALKSICEQKHIRIESADRVLERLSKKENCFAAMVYKKAEGVFDDVHQHIVLHEPGDAGNMGTIMRTALGMGYRNIAIIRPAVDSDDPRTVRASMGAVFSLNVRHFDNIDAYLSEYGERHFYPFMLTGSCPLEQAAANAEPPFSLIFGNEGSGLPDHFSSLGTAVRIPHSQDIDSLNLSVAAGIGMYRFALI